MSDVHEFKKVLQTSCLIVGAAINAKCYVAEFPDDPKPGDRAYIVIGCYGDDKSNREWYVGSIPYLGLKSQITVRAQYLSIDIYEAWEHFQQGVNALDYPAMLERQMADEFFKFNPEYKVYLERIQAAGY